MTVNQQPEMLEELVRLVQASDKYRFISSELVRDLGRKELAKRRNLKEAVKETRTKLHQIGSAYQEKPIPYRKWMVELNNLPIDLHDQTTHHNLQKFMAMHASTNERQSILPAFFKGALGSLAPLHSILDLACGLNPLALPWMPVVEDIEYFACDIYQDMVDFLAVFFKHFHIRGATSVCDLTTQVPEAKVQLALLLKTIPCLDQVDRSAAGRLLDGLQAEHILVSFPAHSLGGRSKGMLRNYEARFEELVAGKRWQITRFEYPGELAFLVKK